MASEREVIYSVEHFYPKHPEHPIGPLTAQVHGYFLEEDLAKSTLSIVGDDMGSIDKLLSGETDISMDAQPAMLIEENARGKDVYIVGSYRNGLPFSIIARPGIIHTPDDLRGKRFTTSRRFGVGERTIRTTCQKLGIDPDRELEMLLIPERGTYEKLEALKEGRADFGIYHHDAEGPIVRNLIDSGELVEVIDLTKLFPFYVTRAMATSGRMLRERADILKAFLKGVMRAQQFMHDEDPMGQDALQILKNTLQVDSLAGSRYENGRPEAWPLQAVDTIASPEGVAAHVEEVKAAGKIPPSFSARQVLRNEPALEALEELGLGYQAEGRTRAL
jgi:ABC-type nitrate/sulfonate/bicarbonate transport system substrate-binding protein